MRHGFSANLGVEFYPNVLFVLHEDANFGLQEADRYAKVFSLRGSKGGTNLSWVKLEDV